jgi:hypothetical protein
VLYTRFFLLRFSSRTASTDFCIEADNIKVIVSTAVASTKIWSYKFSIRSMCVESISMPRLYAEPFVAEYEGWPAYIANIQVNRVNKSSSQLSRNRVRLKQQDYDVDRRCSNPKSPMPLFEF